MSGYIVNFTVYTMAMVGLIFIAFVVAKKSLNFNYFSKKEEQFLEIETSLNLGPRKNVYVIKAGHERFLIASDIEKTSFLTKLEEKLLEPEELILTQAEDDPFDFIENIRTNSSINSKKSVMRGLLDKINYEIAG